MTSYMLFFQRFHQWLDAKLNPIFIKDIRSWLRSKKFMVIFTLTLIVVQLFTIVFTLRATPGSMEGRSLFITMMIGLTFIQTGILPFLMHDRFANELTRFSMELVLVSALTPAQLVRGKMMSGLAASLLFFSAASPGLMIAYLLGGISPVLFIYCASVLLLLSVGVMIMAILFASLLGKKKKSWVLSVVFMLTGFLSTLLILAVIGADTYGNIFDDLAFWPLNIILGGLFVLLLIFYYVTATNRLSFAADNRDTRPRLALSLMTIGAFFVAVLSPLIIMIFSTISSSFDNYIPIGVLFGMVLLVSGSLFVLDTPGKISPRVINQWPRHMIFSTLYYPGIGRLYAFIMAHVLFFFLISFVSPLGRSTSMFFTGSEMSIISSLIPVITGFSLLGGSILVYHLLSRRRFKSLPRTRTVVIVMTSWIFLGILVAFLIDAEIFPGFVHLFFPINALFYVYDSVDFVYERFYSLIAVQSFIIFPVLYLFFKYIGLAILEDRKIRAEKKSEVQAGRQFLPGQP